MKKSRELKSKIDFVIKSGHCTPRQLEILELYKEFGPNEAIKQLNIKDKTFPYKVLTRKLEALERKGITMTPGFDASCPPDYYKNAMTIQRNPRTGEVERVWDKLKQDEASRLAAIERSLDRLQHGIPAVPEIRPPKISRKAIDVANIHTITDFHYGMLAWHKEGGADWDLKIATDHMIKGFKGMLENSPKAHTGYYLNLGDFLHFDGYLPVTPQSGHILDADSRFPKIVDAAVDTMLLVIGMMLKKYKHVKVINLQGNHDMSSSFWLQKICEVAYRNNGRVSVETPEGVEVEKLYLPYWGDRFGDYGLYGHHGHKKNLKQQFAVYPNLFREIWGSTKSGYAYTGHWHHEHVIEENGLRAQMLRTMAAKDAYSSHGAYFAERSLQVDTIHKKHGRFRSFEVKASMI